MNSKTVLVIAGEVGKAHVILGMESVPAKLQLGDMSVNISHAQKTVMALEGNVTATMASASATWVTPELHASRPSGVPPKLHCTKTA